MLRAGEFLCWAQAAQWRLIPTCVCIWCQLHALTWAGAANYGQHGYLVFLGMGGAEGIGSAYLALEFPLLWL